MSKQEKYADFNLTEAQERALQFMEDIADTFPSKTSLDVIDSFNSEYDLNELNEKLSMDEVTRLVQVFIIRFPERRKTTDDRVEELKKFLEQRVLTFTEKNKFLHSDQLDSQVDFDKEIIDTIKSWDNLK